MKISSKTLYSFIYYYFAFSSVAGFLQMAGFEQSKHLLKFVVYPVYILTFYSLKKGIGLIGAAIILTILIIALTSSFQDYSFELYKIGLTGELFAMLFFFVGKFDIKQNEIFNKGVFPVVITGVIGLFLFFSQPSWYLSYKFEGQEAFNDKLFLEITRLSAFWKYPYWISYGSAVLYYYLICKYLKLEKINKCLKLASITLLCVMILAQQRGPLFICIIYTFVILFYSCKNKISGVRNFTFQILFLLLILGVIGLFFLNEELINFMIEKVSFLFDNSPKNNSFLKERADIFSDFYNKEITLWGYGIGRYGHAAMEMGGEVITDQQYLKMVYETGYFGLLSRLVIILFVLYNGIRYFRHYFFEVGIIFMYLITMFGANSLAMTETHNYVFWYCCGRIFSSKYSVIKNAN